MSARRALLSLATAVCIVGSGYVALSAGAWGAESLSRGLSALKGDSVSSPQQREGITRIQLEHADELNFDQSVRSDAQRLIGNVRLRHGNAVMTCDSAYLFEQTQSFEAFGQVQMVQDDTIRVFARHLYYDGRTRLAQLREHVVLENPSTQLYTDHLDYDRASDIAYYFDGGSVVDAQNTLTSDYGEFRPSTNDAEFRSNVKLVNDSTTITTEHLFYNTSSRIARYLGPTRIEADSGYIVSTRGVYDLNNDVGILLERSQLYSGSKTLVGDSIYYDGIARRGEAFGRMELSDTVQRVSLFGDYGFFDDGRSYAFASSRAYALDYSQKDTLYIGADTLEMISIDREIALRRFPLESRRDSTTTQPSSDSLSSNNLRASEEQLQEPSAVDSLVRLIRAYPRVKVYRRDAQAVADSLGYSSLDSILTLYRSPIMWSQERQVSGDTIRFHFRSRKLDHVDILSQAITLERLPHGADYYNQLQGDCIYAYMQDTTIREIVVEGESVESIFYLQQENSTQYTGLDRRTSGRVRAWFSEGAIEKALWKGPVAGKAYPMAMAASAEINRLSRFNWSEERRPRSREDVIPPLDSLLVPEYTLANLKRFRGAQAALKAYEALEVKENSKGVDADGMSSAESSAAAEADEQASLVKASTRLAKSSLGSPSIYYVLEDVPQWQPRRQPDIIDLSWLYKDFIDKEDLDSSSTNRSTGTPAKRS